MCNFDATCPTPGDEQFWKEKAQSNADVDLPYWSQTVLEYSKGEKERMKNQIDFFKWQVSDAILNMEESLPRIK